MRFLRFALVIVASAHFLSGSSLFALSLNLDFSLDRQTYNWSDSASFARSLGKSLDFSVQNRSLATLIRKSVFGAGGDRWQKSARTVAALRYHVSPAIVTGMEFGQDFDRLETKRLIATRAYLITGVQKSHVSFTQRSGLVWEQRRFAPASNSESGFGYQSQISITPRHDLKFGSAHVEGGFTTLRHTPQRNIEFNYEYARNGADGDTLTLEAKQGFGEKKYFPSSGNFDATARQRTEQRRWDFHASRRLPQAFMLTSNAAYRFDGYNYEYDPLVTDLVRQTDNFTSLFEYQLALSRQFGKRLSLQGSYLFNRTKEDFGQLQTNQLAETGQVGLVADILLFGADTLDLSGQMGVTSYLAPTSSTFFADRDRSVTVASLRYIHRFHEFLTGLVEGSYRGFHTIYISGQLSANNNVNNVYIFNPSLIWKPYSQIVVQQSYQMYANYIYYEYEKNELGGRNTLYRRANFASTVTLAGSHRTDLVVEYSYRYEDFGPLVYTDQWQQQISWDRRTHRPRIGIDYRPIDGMRFQPYAVYEIQRSYDHLFDAHITLGRRQLSEEFTRVLIGFDFQWNLTNSSQINCKLERRVQDYQNQRNQEYDLFSISIKRYL